MKITRLIPYLDFGGVEKRIELSSKEFVRRQGVDLSIIALGYGGVVAEILEKSDIQVILLNKPVKIPNLALLRRLITHFKIMKPDVIHCSGAEANFHGLLAAQLAGVPMKIGEEIGFPNHHLLWRLIFKMVYLCADKVIGISHAVADRIVAIGEVPRSKIRVVYNPVAIENALDVTLDLPKLNRFTFITVCRLVPVKNLKGLLRSFAELLILIGPDKAQLNIIGDGPDMKMLRDLCDDLNINENVFFMGYKSAVIPYLKQADAFVLPSFSEGFSIALVEAMLCELPCIVTNVGGPAEIIQEGKTGFLIDPKELKQLVETMEMVFKMRKAERALIGNRAMKDAQERFSVDQYIESLLKVYNSA